MPTRDMGLVGSPAFFLFADGAQMWALAQPASIQAELVQLGPAEYFPNSLSVRQSGVAICSVAQARRSKAGGRTSILSPEVEALECGHQRASTSFHSSRGALRDWQAGKPTETKANKDLLLLLLLLRSAKPQSDLGHKTRQSLFVVAATSSLHSQHLHLAISDTVLAVWDCCSFVSSAAE